MYTRTFFIQLLNLCLYLVTFKTLGVISMLIPTVNSLSYVINWMQVIIYSWGKIVHKLIHYDFNSAPSWIHYTSLLRLSLPMNWFVNHGEKWYFIRRLGNLLILLYNWASHYLYSDHYISWRLEIRPWSLSQVHQL